MSGERHVYNIINSNYVIAGAVLLLIIGTILYTRKRFVRDFVATVVTEKEKKKDLLYFVNTEIQTINQLLDSLTNDLNVVRQFNTMHAEKLGTQANKAKHLYDYLDFLKNPILKAEIINFIENTALIAENIKVLEESYYRYRWNYQKLYSDNNLKFKACLLTDKDFIQKLNTEKLEFQSIFNSYETKRQEYYKYLKDMQQNANKIMNNLSKYQSTEVEHKKFYPRYIAYV